MFQKTSLADSRRIPYQIFYIRIFHHGVLLLWQWAVYTTRWAPKKVEPWITFKFSGCSLGRPTKWWRGRWVGAPPCNKCPHAVRRDASSIHQQPALPPPVSSSALMLPLLLLLPGAKLAGSQPWKMLCWKGPAAHAWLLLSRGEWGSQDLTTNKMAFFSLFLFWDRVVKSVCVIIW